jgi:hypothetical protein
MLFPIFENDFALAKMLPICTVPNNSAITVANANADVLWLFAILITVWFTSPYVSSTCSISEELHNTC